jgi:hypothetical protein
MPRQKSLLTVIRDLVQQEVRSAIQSLLGGASTTPRSKNGYRRRRRRRGPGRPPGSRLLRDGFLSAAGLDTGREHSTRAGSEQHENSDFARSGAAIRQGAIREPRRTPEGHRSRHPRTDPRQRRLVDASFASGIAG